MRYKQLLEYYQKMKWTHEAEWIERRIASMLRHPDGEAILCLADTKAEEEPEGTKITSKKSAKKKTKK